jgi:hypothetical protein
MDRKIEMLSRTGAFDRDDDQEETDEEQSEMDDVEASLVRRCVLLMLFMHALMWHICIE